MFFRTTVEAYLDKLKANRRKKNYIYRKSKFYFEAKKGNKKNLNIFKSKKQTKNTKKERDNKLTKKSVSL